MGTGGVRACAIDAQGDVQGFASTALPAPRQDGDAIDQEPELWWQASVTTIRKLGETIDLGRVERIAVDGTSGTLLLIDAIGRPCSPGLMYNDARAVREAARIADVAPAESGAHGRSSALAKLLHLLNRGNVGNARYAVHQADWIAGRLANRPGINDENNALKLGYDPIARAWPSWLAQLDVDLGEGRARHKRPWQPFAGDIELGEPGRPRASYRVVAELQCVVFVGDAVRVGGPAGYPIG